MNLSKYTQLPYEIVYLGGFVFPEIRVRTPHKGEVSIRLKKEIYSLFSVTVTDRPSDEVIRELRTLEYDAKDYLFDQWKSNVENEHRANQEG